MKDQVLDYLKRHAKAHWWDPAKALEETLILVCPGVKGSGSTVVEAVQELLGLSKIPKVDSGSHGFVVEPSVTGNKSTKLLKYNPISEDKADRMTHNNFRKLTANLPPAEWTYTCGKGWGKSRSSSKAGSMVSRGGSGSEGDMTLMDFLAAGSDSEGEAW